MRPTVLCAVVVLVTPLIADAQINTLAVRTSGTVLQSGDPIRVELVALEHVAGPLSVEVEYHYRQPMLVEDEDGHRSTEMTDRARRARTTPILDHLERLSSIVLDDTLHIGDGSPEGAYRIDVNVFDGTGRTRLASLRTWVVNKTADPIDGNKAHVRDGVSMKNVELAMLGLKRAEAPDWLIFDGVFPATGIYSAVVFHRNRPAARIEAGVYGGAGELTIASDVLGRFAGEVVDIVVHNHLSNLSTTVSRVVVPARNAGLR